MRALLIANRADADPGVIGRLALEAGYRFELLARDDPTAWPDAHGADLVVSLGSDWSVYWERVGAEVAAEAALLAAAHGTGVPILGICFGAQITAHALGGSVAPAPFAEIGWFEIETAAPDMVAPGPWFEWHADQFTVPPGALELAHNAAGAQAFRSGRTMAVQFHPEIEVAILRRWATEGKGALDAAGLSIDALIATTEDNGAANEARTTDLFHSFCREVVGR